jgi:hypothetical protein
MKFLFLGNDAHLRNVNWDLVEKSTLTIVGINRSYLLYDKHDILFLQDPKTALEILEAHTLEEIAELSLLTTPYFKKRLLKDRNKGTISKEEYTQLLELLRHGFLKIHITSRRINHFSPFSLINALASCFDLYREHIAESGECVFYLAGCSLKYIDNENNHFWRSKADNNIKYPTNSPGGSSAKQLKKQIHVLKNLKPLFLAHGIEVVSCNTESPLNQLYAFEELGSVLRKNRKLIKP